jgi:uncharacterized membrane protein YfcA
MDIFEKTSKLSVPAMIFGTLTIIFGWLITGSQDPIVQLKLGEIALVFLSLFFYSLLAEKKRELEATAKKLSEES